MTTPRPTVAILGAPPNAERTSYTAVAKYVEAGWEVWPIHPQADQILGLPVYRSLTDLPGRPEVITLYLREELALPLVQAIADAQPDWVFCNPGADAPALVTALQKMQVPVVVGCNLVALSLGDPRDFAERHAQSS